MRQHALRLDDDLMQSVDIARGQVPRNAYFREMVQQWVRAEEEDPTSRLHRSPTKEEEIEAGGVRPSPEVIEKVTPKAERSPEPGVAIRRSLTEEMGDERKPLSKPPLQRPIVQKKG